MDGDRSIELRKIGQRFTSSGGSMDYECHKGTKCIGAHSWFSKIKIHVRTLYTTSYLKQNKLCVDMLCITVERFGKLWWLLSHPRYHGLFNCVNFLENIPVDFVSYLIDSMKFESVSDYEKYISRLKAIPRLAKEQESLMQEAVAMKITLHERSLIGAIKELEKNAKCPPEESVFYKPVGKIGDVKGSCLTHWGR